MWTFTGADLAGCHVPCRADVPPVEARWIDEDAPHLHPIGSEGVGEIGIVGTAAAIGTPSTMPPESVSEHCPSLRTAELITTVVRVRTTTDGRRYQAA